MRIGDSVTDSLITPMDAHALLPGTGRVDPSRPGGEGFARAGDDVLAYLRATVPMGMWSITRCDGENQVHLSVADSAYGLPAGAAHPWCESLCRLVVEGFAPRIAPVVEDEPALRDAAFRGSLLISAHVGIPILGPGGSLFGTLCGLDTVPHSDALRAQEPLLDLLCRMLGDVLTLDLERAAADRRLERTQLEPETDLLTGLLNRHGWLRRLELESARQRVFGDQVQVVVVRLEGASSTRGTGTDDECLRRAARTMRAALRPGDILARLSGNEFRLLVPGASAEAAAGLAGRLRTALTSADIPVQVHHESLRQVLPTPVG